MSLLDKINDVMNNPSEIINSIKESPTITKSAVLLTMVAAATALNPMQAVAHQTDTPHVHYEYANIAGESVLVKDHIQNISDEHGISLDQQNDYLNYKHPQHSKINEYIDFVAENRSKEEFEDLKILVEKAQKHYNNGHYSLMDSEAHYLMPVTDISPIFAINATPEGQIYDYSSENHKNTEAAISLFNKMANDSDFSYEGQSIQIDEDSFNVSRTAVKNKSFDEGFVMAYFDNDNDIVSNISIASWKYTGMDLSNDINEKLKEDNGLIKYLGEGYELTDKDKKILKKIPYSHEIGHLNASGELLTDKANNAAENELLAEVMSTWEGIKNGGSEGYLELRKDTNNSSVALVPDSQSHNGYGLLKTFYDQYSHDEVKNMSLDDITININTFIKSIPEDVLEFGEYAKITAKEEVKNNGIFPKAQEYFKNVNDQDKYEFLNSAKTIPYTNTTQLLAEQLDTVRSPDSSFFEKFTANNFPETIYKIEHDRYDINHESVVNYVNQVNQHITSGEYLNSDFEYKKGDFKNSFDKLEAFAQISDTVKIDNNGTVIIADHDVTPTNYDISMDYETKIEESNITISLEDDKNNEIKLKIEKSGHITASLNQSDFENISIKHFEGFDKQSYNYNNSLNFIKDIAEKNDKFAQSNTFETTPVFKTDLEVEVTPSFKHNTNAPEYTQDLVIDNSNEKELLSVVSSEINEIKPNKIEINKSSSLNNKLSNK